MIDENIKIKLEKYFEPGNLEILDDGFNCKKYYTGVTIKYLIEYLCLNDNPLDVISTVEHLFNIKKLDALYCGGVDGIVFEKYNETIHWSYHSSPLTKYKYTKQYLYDHINYLKKIYSEKKEPYN